MKTISFKLNQDEVWKIEEVYRTASYGAFRATISWKYIRESILQEINEKFIPEELIFLIHTSKNLKFETILENRKLFIREMLIFYKNSQKNNKTYYPIDIEQLCLKVIELKHYELIILRDWLVNYWKKSKNVSVDNYMYDLTSKKNKSIKTDTGTIYVDEYEKEEQKLFLKEWLSSN